MCQERRPTWLGIYAMVSLHPLRHFTPFTALACPRRLPQNNTLSVSQHMEAHQFMRGRVKISTAHCGLVAVAAWAYRCCTGGVEGSEGGAVSSTWRVERDACVCRDFRKRQCIPKLKSIELAINTRAQRKTRKSIH